MASAAFCWAENTASSQAEDSPKCLYGETTLAALTDACIAVTSHPYPALSQRSTQATEKSALRNDLEAKKPRNVHLHV